MSLVVKNNTVATQYVQGLIFQADEERDLFADLTPSELLDARVDPLGKGLADAIEDGDFSIISSAPVVCTLDYLDAKAPAGPILEEITADGPLVAGRGYVVPASVVGTLTLDLPDPETVTPDTGPIVVVNLTLVAVTIDAGLVDILPGTLTTLSLAAGQKATLYSAQIGADLVYVSA